MTKDTVKDLMEFLESIAPFDLQESYDNSGHLIGDPGMEIEGVLCSLDCTVDVVDEAVERGCNVILSHHPLIFRGIKRLTGEDYIQKTVIRAVQKNVAIISIHTNLDNVLHNGVNEKIALRLGLMDIEVLQPSVTSHSDFETGAGVLGFLPEKKRSKEFLQSLKKVMKTGCIRYTPLVKEYIHKVAVCGGSGSFLLQRAIDEEADIFISADFKYHDFFHAGDNIIIADVGHYESEQFTVELLFDLLQENFSNFAPHYSNHNTNPVKYL